MAGSHQYCPPAGAPRQQAIKSAVTIGGWPAPWASADTPAIFQYWRRPQAAGPQRRKPHQGRLGGPGANMRRPPHRKTRSGAHATRGGTTRAAARARPAAVRKILVLLPAGSEPPGRPDSRKGRAGGPGVAGEPAGTGSTKHIFCGAIRGRAGRRSSGLGDLQDLQDPRLGDLQDPRPGDLQDPRPGDLQDPQDPRPGDLQDLQDFRSPGGISPHRLAIPTNTKKVLLPWRLLCIVRLFPWAILHRWLAV